MSATSTTIAKPAPAAQAALDYLSRGWAPIPVPYRSKNPGRDGQKEWQKLRLDEAGIRQRFNGQPQNVGVLLGEPSDWLIDVDLDHPAAVELAPKYLPATGAVFGRQSKRRSHYLYQTTGPIESDEQGKSKVYRALVELRSTGLQTIFPGSTHDKSGERVEWESDEPPAKIDPEVLLRAALDLRRAAHDKLETWKTDKAFDEMMTLPIADGNDGSNRLVRCARIAILCGLSDQQAIDTIRAYADQKGRGFPKAYTDADILRRVRDAEKRREQQATGSEPRPTPQPKGQPKAEDEKPPEPVHFPRISCIELARTTYNIEFLIERVLAARQPAVLAGPQKGMKTSLLIDLGIALAQGGFFLGKFRVPRAVRVGIMTGESGLPVIQDTARAVCQAAGYNLEDVGSLVFSDRVPRFNETPHLDGLREFIEGDELEVLAIDPAYLAMPGGDAGNLFIQGEMLANVNRVCEETGCTFILCHHTRKRREAHAKPFEPLELVDIAWAGFPEWARQWMLVNRREKYEPGTGDHRLWLSVGGSLGHSGLWGIDIEQGVWPDRYWEVAILSAEDAAREDAERAENSKASEEAEKKAVKVVADKRAIVKIMAKWPDGETKRTFREACGMSGGRFNQAFAQLIDDGDVIQCAVKKENRRSYDGWKLATDGE